MAHMPVCEWTWVARKMAWRNLQYAPKQWFLTFLADDPPKKSHGNSRSLVTGCKSCDNSEWFSLLDCLTWICLEVLEVKQCSIKLYSKDKGKKRRKGRVMSFCATGLVFFLIIISWPLRFISRPHMRVSIPRLETLSLQTHSHIHYVPLITRVPHDFNGILFSYATFFFHNLKVPY